MRVADGNSSDDDIPIDDCFMLDYQVVNRAPAFEIEMKDDTFCIARNTQPSHSWPSENFRSIRCVHSLRG